MRRLMLLRHAKSDWSNDELPDHDRPLAARGIRAAELVRTHLDALEVHPTLVLCSSARRARETLAIVLPGLGPELTIRIEPELYTFSSRDVLTRIHKIPDETSTALAVGHNPAMEDVARLLAPEADAIGAKFPTGALATLEFDVGLWTDVTDGAGTLVGFVTPRRLEAGA